MLRFARNDEGGFQKNAVVLRRVMHHFAYRDGVLHAEAVNLAELAEVVGTPFYCYSSATIERHYQVFAGAFADVANLVREQARKSDIVAKTGDTQLSVLAPDTDAAGARLLVARLQRELEATSGKRRLGTPVRLRAGYCAVSDLAAAKVDLSELVHRAESALASLPISGDGETVVGFDEVQSAHQMPPPH